jgi:hypothetical protein
LATGLTTAVTKDGQTTTTARITFAQGFTSSLVTDSSSVSTGSIITGGGVGIAKALYVGTTANFAGVVTLTAQPILSSLTASKPVFTDASKGLVSTGTLGADQGGTGVANNVAATVTSSGNFAYTRTLTGTTNVTLPTTGTLATLAGTETFTNKTLTTPVIASISNSGTITVPTGTDTLVGRATTDTLTNKTLTNPTVTNYVETVVAIGNSGTSQTLSLTNGTVQTVTMTGNCTFTMPTATAGKSFILIATQDGTGSRTAVFTSVKFASGTAPTLTTTATTGVDILTFVANGTSWFGTYAQAFA